MFSRKKKHFQTYLVAFGDTEGVKSRNGLWSLTLLFKAIVHGPPGLSSMDNLKLHKPCYHMLSYNGQEFSEKSTSKAISSHFRCIDSLTRQYKAEGVLLCFWNASHDRGQFEPYQKLLSDFPGINITFVDMLRFVKSLTRFPKYTLNYLRYELYASPEEKSKGKKQTHDSLDDTEDMLHVLYSVVSDSMGEQLSTNSVARMRFIYYGMSTVPEESFIKHLVGHPLFLIGLLGGKRDKPVSEKLLLSSKQKPKPKPSVQQVGKSTQIACTIGEEDNESTLSPLPVVSVDKYEYFSLDETDYKVRRGYRNSHSRWFEGFGLYELRGGQFKVIRDKTRKENVLQSHIKLTMPIEKVKTGDLLGLIA